MIELPALLKRFITGLLDGTIPGIDYTTTGSADRTYNVPAEGRTYSVAFESRTLTVTE